MRYAILSDIHANFAALCAIQREIDRLRDLEMDDPPIPIWFLGDLVGYGPQPVECIRWLRHTSGIYADGSADSARRWVPGNHDELIMRHANTSQHRIVDGYDEEHRHDRHPDAEISLRRHEQLLAEPANNDLGGWFHAEVRAAIDGPTPDADGPRSMVREPFSALTAIFTHGVPLPLMWREKYLYPWKTELLNEVGRQMAELTNDRPQPGVLFCGHTHFPMWVRWSPDTGPRLQSIKYGKAEPLGEGVMFINPGSVGQPRDGDPRAAYMLLDPDAGTVEFRRVEYALEETSALLQRYPPYPDALVERLRQANSDINRQQFETLYRRPKWDLEVV